MRQSFDWENSVTGAGIRDRDGATTFKQTIIDKCPFYFYLKDLFADRAGFKPLATNLNLFSSDEDNLNVDIDILSDDDEEEIEDEATDEVRLLNTHYCFNIIYYWYLNSVYTW